MSTSDPRVGEPAAQPAERDQPPRLGWKPALLVGGGVGLAAVLVSAWFVITSLQLGQVEVDRTTPVECRGTEVTEERVGTGGPVTAMRLVPGMKCTIGVQVTNEGTSAVKVTEVLLPYMGPDGGAAVRVNRLDRLEPEPEPADTIDALFTVDQELAAGEDYEFEMTFVFRPRGCTSQGVMTVPGMPTVTVSSWGREVERTADEPVAFRGTKQSNCDS